MKNYFKLFAVIAVSFSFLFALPIKDLPASAEELAPDFKLQDLENNTFILSNYNGQKPVILFFWTTWCPSCRSELKALKKRYPELVKKDWELLAIDVGESAYQVKNFLENYSLDFKILLDKNTTVAYAYGVFGIPTYILVDKEGYIVFKGNHFPEEEYFN